MKHAGDIALEPLLFELRKLPRLRETKRGTFYVGSKAFVDFHEDPDGPFADMNGGYEQFRVRTARERMQLVSRARRALK